MPFGVLAVWFALVGLFRAWRLYRSRSGVRAKPARRDMIVVSHACR